MLIIVILKPIQFTIVSAEPLFSGGADCATKVDSIGESAITLSPQIIRKNKNKGRDPIKKKTGEITQQISDTFSAKRAMFFAPFSGASNPENTHARLPIPIIINDHKETFISAECIVEN